MKKILIFLICVISTVNIYAASPKASEGVVKEISASEFKKLVSNYDGGYKNWSYQGTRPAIIDFYASWCGPCKQLSPIVEELAKEYKGKIDFYKVNIDDNKDLAIAYSISSIPLLLYAPVTGKPQTVAGLYPKSELINAINFVFFPKAK